MYKLRTLGVRVRAKESPRPKGFISLHVSPLACASVPVVVGDDGFGLIRVSSQYDPLAAVKSPFLPSNVPSAERHVVTPSKYVFPK